MRFLVAIMLMLALTACGSNNDASTASGEKEKVSKEEKEYVELLLDGDFEALNSATKEKNNDIQYDYYYLAQAFTKQQDLIDKYGEGLDVKVDIEVSIAYKSLESIIKYIEDFGYGNEEVQDKIADVEKWAKENQSNLKDRYEEVAEKQKAYEEEMEKLNKEAESK